MMDDGLLQKVQLVELDILREVMRLCEANQIEYFIHGGTALGAQKYGGFIPWDDDIDIGMAREHYDRFLAVAAEQLDKAYFLQTPDTDEHSPYAYTKIRKNDSEFVEWSVRGVAMHHGIFVDVYPYDNVPDTEGARKWQFWSVQFLRRLFVFRQIPNVSRRPLGWLQELRARLRKALYLLARKSVPKRLVLRLLDRQLRRYSHQRTTMKACLFCPVYMKNYIARPDMYPLRLVTFEKLALPALHNLDAYLTNRYGDYSQLPPKETRTGHSPYRIRVPDMEQASL